MEKVNDWSFPDGKFAEIATDKELRNKWIEFYKQNSVEVCQAFDFGEHFKMSREDTLELLVCVLETKIAKMEHEEEEDIGNNWA